MNEQLAKHYKVVHMPLISEKALQATGPFERDRKGDKTDLRRAPYVFWVDRNANKIEIKQAIEAIFDVKVDKIRTSVAKGGRRRARFRKQPVPPRKKAYVLLKDGESIEYSS